jgi:2,4-diaminopentanoate dehydrogenase
MERQRIRTALWGIGALGTLVAKAASTDDRIELVAAVDNDPAKTGRSLAEVAGGAGTPDLTIIGDIASPELQAARPQLIIHMIESRMERITPQLVQAMDMGLNVISAAETMFYPSFRYPDATAHLDGVAKKNGVSLSGTGINPGFIFDKIVLDAAFTTGDITAIRLGRVVEVSDTGPGDIEHVGFGLPVAEFISGVNDGRISGHIGLPESFVLLAERLGLAIDNIEESWDPVTSDTPIASTMGPIPVGNVTGIIQGARAFDRGKEIMTARLAMYFSDALAEEPRDSVEIDGSHDLRMTFTPANISILGAAHAITNSVAITAAAPPGMVNLVDLPASSDPRKPGLSLRFDAGASTPGKIKISASQG